MRKIKKIAKYVMLFLTAIVAAILAVHTIGSAINSMTPKGGINESMYVEINGTEQWINIYGEDIDNPVLLYLHGGPGSATSDIDYAFTRKWADVYTVVTWDQRNCGKSYDKEQNCIVLTKELLMEDGREMTEFLLDYMGKDKITLLGHSWGSYYGANLALEYPEYYECFIGTGQLVDMTENEAAFKEEALRWAEGDEEALALVGRLTPDDFNMDHIKARNALMEKYSYNMMVDGADYNLIATILFNPNYSIVDWIKYFQRDMGVYLDFFSSDELLAFSLKGRYDYKIPYYNINGDKDYQTNYKLAQEYFEKVNAPHKEMFMMKDTTHGLLESKSEYFSEILHQIAEMKEDYLDLDATGYDSGGGDSLLELTFENKKPLPLWDTVEETPWLMESVSEENRPSITPFIIENNANGGCVIICPGGGYTYLEEEKEGSVLAEALNEQGISAFVLRYRTVPYDRRAMISDVCRAVRFVRYYAEQFEIEPDKVALMGFSAGGHLVAMNLEHAGEDIGEDDSSADDIDKLDGRADYGILCYPVISLVEPYGHEMSAENFLGAENADNRAMAEKYSAQFCVTEDMPPCFVWHCKTDTLVDYTNSQMFADAMEEAGAECELHLYEDGQHGLGIAAADNAGEAKQWFGQCISWLQRHGF